MLFERPLKVPSCMCPKSPNTVVLFPPSLEMLILGECRTSSTYDVVL
jgi:hypothetical protein